MSRKTVTVQFPEELLQQIDETALRLAKHGILLRRSGTIRMLIERALSDQHANHELAIFLGEEDG